MHHTQNVLLVNVFSFQFSFFNDTVFVCYEWNLIVGWFAFLLGDGLRTHHNACFFVVDLVVFTWTGPVNKVPLVPKWDCATWPLLMLDVLFGNTKGHFWDLSFDSDFLDAHNVWKKPVHANNLGPDQTSFHKMSKTAPSKVVSHNYLQVYSTFTLAFNLLFLAITRTVCAGVTKPILTQ